MNSVESIFHPVDGKPFVGLRIARQGFTALVLLSPNEAINLGSQLQAMADEVHRRREDLRKAKA